MVETNMIQIITKYSIIRRQDKKLKRGALSPALLLLATKNPDGNIARTLRDIIDLLVLKRPEFGDKNLEIILIFLETNVEDKSIFKKNLSKCKKDLTKNLSFFSVKILRKNLIKKSFKKLLVICLFW